MTRYFIDTEFEDTGTVIKLISIGIISEDNREYYAQDCTYDVNTPNTWLKAHVIPHLDPALWKSREQIKRDLLAFMDTKLYDSIEWIMWCGCYDYVVICQLFGGMMSLPECWPHSITDLQYLLDQDSISDEELPPQEGTAHNALSDARHIRTIWEWL